MRYRIATSPKLDELIGYLSKSDAEKGEELAVHDAPDLFVAYVAEKHPAVAQSVEVEQVDEDEGIGFGEWDYFEEPQRTDVGPLLDAFVDTGIPLQDVFADFYAAKRDEARGHHDLRYSSHVFMDLLDVVPASWLVHFSDHGFDVATEGFQTGVADATMLGLTTEIPWEEKTTPGYGFAFPLDAVEKWYGSEAVVFRAPSVRVWHRGDEETQSIFWGPDATDRIVIAPWQKKWLVHDCALDDVYEGRTLQDAIDWATRHPEIGCA